MRFLLPLFIATLATGCVVYDEQLIHDGDTDSSDRPDRDTDTPDTDEPDVPEDFKITFAPATLSQGDVVIASIKMTNPPDSLNMRELKSVQFAGPSTFQVLSSQPRNSTEFQMALKVKGPSLAGINDVIVTFGNDSSLLIDNAVEVIGDPLEPSVCD